MSPENFDTHYRQKKSEGLEGWDLSLERTQSKIQTLEFFRRLPNFPQKGQALEMGCGAGNLSLEMAKHGYEITGVDSSPNAISWAQEKVHKFNFNATFLVGNVCDLKEIKSAHFDWIFDGFVFQCLTQENDREKYLKEVSRLLKPKGWFTLRAFCGSDLKCQENFSFDPQTRCLLKNNQPHRYVGTSDGIASQIEIAGLKIIFQKLNEKSYQETIDEMLFATRIL